MNMDEILTLVQAVSDSKLTSFKLDQGDMHISLKKEKEEAKIITVGAPGAVAAVPAPSAAPVVTAASAGVSTEAPAAAPEAAESHDIASDKVITSPLVGTFYSSSSPDAESFVKEGDTVKKGQVLGIIEAMKLMNEIDALVEYAKGFGAKGLAYIAINEDGTYKSSFAKFMKDEEMAALVAAMDGKPGDLLLFAADRDKVVFDVLGNLRLELARQLDLLKKDDFKFLWVTEFPLLEYSEEEGRFVAMHHPFTMPMDEDLQYIDSDPGRVRAKAYDIVLNGVEMGGGSVRIHQADIQSKMFEVLGFTPERANDQFGFLLKAFKYGVPPHAGLAYGFDRMIMLMVGADSIRDVIAFPKVKDASCLMTKAPAPVDPKQLGDLGIEVIPEEKEE